MLSVNFREQISWIPTAYLDNSFSVNWDEFSVNTTMSPWSPLLRQHLCRSVHFCKLWDFSTPSISIWCSRNLHFWMVFFYYDGLKLYLTESLSIVMNTRMCPPFLFWFSSWLSAVEGSYPLGFPFLWQYIAVFFSWIVSFKQLTHIKVTLSTQSTILNSKGSY